MPLKPYKRRGKPILRRLPIDRGAVVVEVGVLAGALSRYLLEEHAGVHLVMVDSWSSAENHTDDYKATGDSHAVQSAAEATWQRSKAEEKIEPYRDRVTILALPSVDAALRIADQSCDLVFIDADHSYSGVSSDLAAWAAKVKPDGYIGGHDYNNPSAMFRFGVNVAVDEFVAQNNLALETDDNHTWFCRMK